MMKHTGSGKKKQQKRDVGRQEGEKDHSPPACMQLAISSHTIKTKRQDLPRSVPPSNNQ